MRFWMGFSLSVSFLLAEPVLATTPQSEARFQRVIGQTVSQMLPLHAKTLSDIKDLRLTVSSFDRKNKNCLDIRERTETPKESGIRTRYVEFKTYKQCLDDVNTDWSHEFNRELIQYWFENLSNSKRSRVISVVYENEFFHLHRDFEFHINRKISRVVARALEISAMQVLQNNQRFKERHADAVRLIQDLFIDQKDIYSWYENFVGGESMAQYPAEARLKYITESQEAWFIRYDMIKSAKKSIRFQTFSLFDDLFGRAIVGLLLEAIDRGVKVQVMLDARGSFGTSRGDLVELLVKRGAEVASYNSLMLNALNINKFVRAGIIKGLASSNHDKLLIVDDTKVLTGGRNTGTRYFVKYGEAEGRIYQDLDVYAEFKEYAISPIAAFNIEFYSANSIGVISLNISSKELRRVQNSLKLVESRMMGRALTEEEINLDPEIRGIRSLSEYPNFSPEPSEDYHPVRGLDKTSVLLNKNVLTKEIFDDINRAQRRIVIVNPYVILTSGMKHQLVQASQRGVEIEIITTSPTSTDSMLTQGILVDEWKDLLREIPTLKLHGAIGPTQLHAKAFVFDDEIALIGSYNMDPLSERVNSEYSLKITSPEIVAEFVTYLKEFRDNETLQYDLEKNIGPHSQPNGEKKYKKVRRLMWISRILRPVL